jgi:uncharacterized protein with von Willebrand factor type A (vWA) domain
MAVEIDRLGSEQLAADRLHAFVHDLGASGLAVSVPKKLDFLQALAAEPPQGIGRFYWMARVTLMTSIDDLDTFDSIFWRWFGGVTVSVEPALEDDDDGDAPAPDPPDDGMLPLAELLPGTGVQASALEIAPGRRFAPIDAAGRDGLRCLGRTLDSALPLISARRMARGRRRERLDVRRTLRRATRTGGEVVELSWRSRPPRRRRVLVLIDVSGSQRRHLPDLLRFAHVVISTAPRAEAFTFGTRLHRVTAPLAARDVDEALAAVADTVLDVDGGTRIGAVLQELLANGRAVACARDALIIVLSDGLERGDPTEMTAAVERLGRIGHRLLWWSPLACEASYQPITRGISAILDVVDHLDGAQDLATLQAATSRIPDVCARSRRMATRSWPSSPAA